MHNLIRLKEITKLPKKSTKYGYSALADESRRKKAETIPFLLSKKEEKVSKNNLNRGLFRTL